MNLNVKPPVAGGVLIGQHGYSIGRKRKTRQCGTELTVPARRGATSLRDMGEGEKGANEAGLRSALTLRSILRLRVPPAQPPRAAARSVVSFPLTTCFRAAPAPPTQQLGPRAGHFVSRLSFLGVPEVLGGLSQSLKSTRSSVLQMARSGLEHLLSD